MGKNTYGAGVGEGRSFFRKRCTSRCTVIRLLFCCLGGFGALSTLTSASTRGSFLFFTRAIVVWTKLPRTTLGSNNHHRSAAIWADLIGLLELSTSRQRIAGLALLVVGAANKALTRTL